MWTWLFWFQPARSFPVIKDAIIAVDHLFDLVPITGSFAWAFKSYVLVLLPVVVILAIVRRPTALGLGGMSRYGWRIIVLGFVIALPFCIWLGLRPGMHAHYRYMFTGPRLEVTARQRPRHRRRACMDRRCDSGAGATRRRFFGRHHEPDRRGALAFVGLGFPVGLAEEDRTLWQWLGVPAIAMPCLILQALTFGAVHAGKEWGELVTAFPGGLGLGMLTYRIRSFWPAVVLHLGTGAIILLTMVLSR